MEEVLLRFPLLSDSIFDVLDNKSFIKCMKICKSWNEFAKEKKWIRIIQKHDKKTYKKYTDCPQKLREKLKKINADEVEEFAEEILKEPDYSRNTSLHIAAKKGHP